MRMIVFFDLPVLTSKQRRDYRDFRKFLLKSGFLMLQESVYCKLVQNPVVADVLQTSIEDIESIVELCDTYDAKCPHEFKLVYNVNSKSFDSNYNYENATDVYDKDVIELVEEWFNECEKNISH